VCLIVSGCGHLQNTRLLISNIFSNGRVMFENHVGYHFLKVLSVSLLHFIECLQVAGGVQCTF
jgi:hypothetical protein